VAPLDFRLLSFDDFDTRTLYAVLGLRAKVFVVEQRCQYLDPDGKDLVAQHLLAYREGALVGYLRIVPPGSSFPEHAIGRVLTVPDARGLGVGRALLKEALGVLSRTQGPVPVSLAAQAHLVPWYESMGFRAVSEVYEEAGVPHVDMRYARLGDE
jgi:ElaA protein